MDGETNSDQWAPIAFHTKAFNEYAAAYELAQIAFRIDQAAILPRVGLTPEQNEQRKALLKVAQKIILGDRDRAMDKVVAHWTKYRTMRPADE